MEDTQQTPEQLLEMILGGDRDTQLKICRLAIGASDAASDCLMSGHIVTIDNLKRHIAELSGALLTAVRGEDVDPILLQTARGTINSLEVTHG